MTKAIEVEGKTSVAAVGGSAAILGAPAKITFFTASLLEIKGFDTNRHVLGKTDGARLG